MELNVCGAIPPYNEILGGKLVALLATSPQVISDYRDRYSDKRSEIASRLKGEDVCRPADLVYVGTTSLYYVGSSQYNRLKIPGYIFNSSHDVRWKELGKTVGFAYASYKQSNHHVSYRSNKRRLFKNQSCVRRRCKSEDEIDDYGY